MENISKIFASSLEGLLKLTKLLIIATSHTHTIKVASICLNNPFFSIPYYFKNVKLPIERHSGKPLILVKINAMIVRSDSVKKII